MGQSSGGLSKDQIEDMIKQAEAHAEEDKERKERVEARNNAESVAHDTEKNLEEFKDDVDQEAADELRAKITELKEALNNTELSAEEIRTRAGEVQQQSLKVFEVACKKRAGSSEGAGSSSSSEGGAKDADFEDVKDKK